MFMEKKIRVTRKVEDFALKDYGVTEQSETFDYSILDASKQGFLASMCDGEHYIICRMIEV